MNKTFERLRLERQAFIKHRGAPPKAMYITKHDVRDIASSITLEGNPHIIKEFGGPDALTNMMISGELCRDGLSFMGVPLKPVSWGV